MDNASRCVTSTRPANSQLGPDVMDSPGRGSGSPQKNKTEFLTKALRIVRAAAYQGGRNLTRERAKELANETAHEHRLRLSYAPGALFTYEGGMECCLCVAIPKNTPYET